MGGLDTIIAALRDEHAAAVAERDRLNAQVVSIEAAIAALEAGTGPRPGASVSPAPASAPAKATPAPTTRTAPRKRHPRGRRVMGGHPNPARTVALQRGHQHPEAFCLMLYQSKDGNVLRHVWNSRDGVTPFAFLDPASGVEVFHVRWVEDLYWPDYHPNANDLVFADVHRSLDEWREIFRRKVEALPQYAPEPGPGREAFITHLAEQQMIEDGERGTVALVTGAEWFATRSDRDVV